MIFLDTNVVSEPLRKSPSESVLAWLDRHDGELALSTVVIAEVAFGIAKLNAQQSPERLERGLVEWRRRLAGQIFAFTEDAALSYGDLMGEAVRRGKPMATGDAMIAAIAKVHGGGLATRNTKDFALADLRLINPWEY